MEKEKKIQSANFKKDYVTFCAVAIFIIMVISELFVAVSIPITINHTALYAEHGFRQKTIASFDALRSQCRRKPNNSDRIVPMEKQLILWDLDIISSHLREYSRSMPVKEIENLNSDIAFYNNIVSNLNDKDGHAVCQANSLDLTSIAKRIEQKISSLKD